jgi:hypothetical protein
LGSSLGLAVTSAQFQIGYGEELLDYDPTKNFYVKAPLFTRTPEQPFEEAILSFRKLYDCYQEPLNLCLSGGIDSESMALACLSAQVPFYVSTLRLTNGLNDEDIQHAMAFCRENSIKQNLIDLDIINFFETRQFEEYFFKYNCIGVEIAAQFYFLDQLKGPVIWGGEAFRALCKDGKLYLQLPGQIEAAFHRYFRLKNLAGTPDFHFSTSELSWAFFKNGMSKIQTLYEDDQDPKFYADKLDFYRRAGFDLAERENRSRKRHGFEQVKHFFDTKLAVEGSGYIHKYRNWARARCPIEVKSILVIPTEDPIRKNFVGF